ncbi:MAG: hypothetical protein ACLGI2_14510 [Acidimicrobiia bacterium]
MSDAERRRRRLTYIGKRVAASGGLMGFWIDEEGNEYGYRKLAPEAAPGSRYDVTLSADGSVFLGGEDAPCYVDRLPLEDERVLAWTARDRTARTTHAQAARARRDSKGDALAEACRLMRDLYAAERTATGRTALLATVIEQITRPLSRPERERAH